MDMKPFKSMVSSKGAGWQLSGWDVAILLARVGMTRYHDGGSVLDIVKRPLLRPLILILLVAGLALAGCRSITANDNWPGMAVRGETVYLAYGPGVMAVDMLACQEIWHFPEKAQANLVFYAPPTLLEDEILLGDYGASEGFLPPVLKVTLYSINDAESGVAGTRWTSNDFTQGRIVASPVMVDDTILVATGNNSLFALDADTRAVKWEFQAEHSLWSAPVVRGQTIYLSSLDKHIYALSLATGEEIWQHALDGAVPSAPVLGDGLLYVGGFYEKLQALDLETGDEQWSVAIDNWIWGTPTLQDGVLYFADLGGDVYAVNALTGAEIWSTHVVGSVQASPVVAGDKVYIATQGNMELNTGELYALAIEDGGQVWQKTTNMPLYTTPVVVGDTLVVALNGEEALLAGYGLEDGSQQCQFLPVEEE